MGYLRLWGVWSSTEVLGGSVARAREANVSIMRLTHSIYMALRGDSVKTRAPRKLINNATILTVS